MSYEMMMGFGNNGGNGNKQDMVFGERIDVVQPPDGNVTAISPLAVGGIIALIGGLVLFAVAIPFGIGAASAATAAPEGRRWKAAKLGAVAGGFGGLAAYPILYGLTGSSGIARAMSSFATIALGVYMGIREREKLAQERAAFNLSAS